MTTATATNPPSSAARLTPMLYARSAWAFTALTLCAVLAFWPNYLAKPLDKGIRFHLHAAAMGGWCALLIAQAFLIRGGNRARHRRLGALGWILGPAVALSILVLNHHQSQTREITAFRLWLFTSNIGDATLFFLCWLLAMMRRKTPAVHARYMTCTAVTFIPPIFDRLFSRFAMTPQLAAVMPVVGGEPFTILPSFVMVFIALGALAWADRRSPKRSRVFGAMCAIFAAWYAAPLLLMTLPWWRSAIVWYLSLPLS